MVTTGYILKGNAATASPDYLPSMIGIVAGQEATAGRDPYFELVTIPTRKVTSLAASRWWSYESLEDGTHDPILEVRSPGLNYYMPYSELYAIAAENHDDDTIEMLEALGTPRRAL